jgi:type VI secretion system ImpM family protein
MSYTMDTTGGTAGGAAVIGVYGKVGTQPDFMRSNAGEFSQAGLDQWFQEGIEAIRNDGTTLPAPPTAFLLLPVESPLAFIGAFAASADAAGRSFPLAVFAGVDASGIADTQPSLISDYGMFVEDAAGTAIGGVGLPAHDLAAQVQALTAQPAGFNAGAVAALLADETAQHLVAALGGSPPALGYALRTFIMACDQAVKTGPAAARGSVITVDAPAPTPATRTLWLELARRRLRWREAAPSLLWTGGPAGRLLLTLGQPTPAALSYLANPRHRAPRFWPLRTEVATAIDQANKALTPEQRRRVENPHASLADLLSAFGV